MNSIHNILPNNIHHAEMALAAALRLTRVQASSGLYLYQYDAIRNVPSNRNYSIVRMAGATYSMCWAAQFFAGSRAGEVIGVSARRAAEFLLRTCQFANPAFFVCDFTFEKGMRKHGSTGATALLANALLCSPHTEEYKDELTCLIHTLLLSQTSAGAIRDSLHTTRILGGQRYYPGEALLALVRYGVAFHNEEILKRVRLSMSFYENYFTVDPHLGLVLWHVDCWTRMARIAHETDDLDFCRRCLKFVQQLLARIVNSTKKWSAFRRMADPRVTTLRIGASTALYTEAISRYLQCSDIVEDGQNEYLSGLRSNLEDGLYCLEQLQLREQINGQQVDERLALGGCQSIIGSGCLRMDNDQHLITACLAVIESQHLGHDEGLKKELTA